MTNSLKHWTLVLGVLGLFFISSVGIPIVIASCPMMMNGSFAGWCCPERNQRGTVKLLPVTDYSCCKTVIAAERNTTQYVQAERGVASLEKEVASNPGTILTELVAAGSLTLPDLTANPPPRTPDIPILFSSLQI